MLCKEPPRSTSTLVNIAKESWTTSMLIMLQLISWEENWMPKRPRRMRKLTHCKMKSLNLMANGKNRRIARKCWLFTTIKRHLFITLKLQIRWVLSSAHLWTRHTRLVWLICLTLWRFQRKSSVSCLSHPWSLRLSTVNLLDLSSKIRQRLHLQKFWATWRQSCSKINSSPSVWRKSASALWSANSTATSRPLSQATKLK